MAWGPYEICLKINAKLTLIPMKEKLTKKLAFFRNLQPKCVGCVSKKKQLKNLPKPHETIGIHGG
jgi:hypothetical protein